MNAVIIGAGVSGLSAACVLHEAEVSVTILGASGQVGDRVRSLLHANGQHLGDLGPSWVWPPYQPHLTAWLDKLGLSTIDQYEEGEGCVERAIYYYTTGLSSSWWTSCGTAREYPPWFLNNRPHFAVAATATVSPGLLEGALLAGELAAGKVLGAAAKGS